MSLHCQDVYISCFHYAEHYGGSLSPIHLADETVEQLINKGIIKKPSNTSKFSKMYKTKGGKLVLILNQEDHLRIATTSKNGDVKVCHTLQCSLLKWQVAQIKSWLSGTWHIWEIIREN